MPRRRSAHATPDPQSHLVRSEVWSGIRSGQPVAVDGVRARGASWEFVAHVRNARTGDEWVEVVGGKPGSRALRSFRPHRIFPAGGGAPLAAAPQLPF
ncbi:MAG: DUF7246 family protein [Acidimicrobiales bacterium]